MERSDCGNGAYIDQESIELNNAEISKLKFDLDFLTKKIAIQNWT